MQIELSNEEAWLVFAALVVAKDDFAQKAIEQGELLIDGPLPELLEHADDTGKISKRLDDLAAKFARLIKKEPDG